MKQAPGHVSRVLATPVRGVYSTCTDSGRHFGRHWHDAYGFGFLEDGAHISASGRGRVRAYAGDVITTNPGEVHDGLPLGGPSRRWRIIHMDVDVLIGITPSGRTGAEIMRPVIEDPDLVRMLRQLFHRLEGWNADGRSESADSLACEEALVETCVLLMSRHGTERQCTKVAAADLCRVRDCLSADLLNAPTLDDMAMMTGLSRFQLLRQFQRTYGMPPHAWLLHQRAERARVLIRNGAGLAAAAAGSGFADQSHMTRVFVRQYGFTPGAWKKAVVPQ